jgi:three-Cys-motif partner protein
MAKDLGTVWDLEPHTAAKHAILRRYLQAWIPILSSAHGRVVYIDGFAGPGVYSRGEDGSPVIAVKSALEHASRIRGEIAFLFVELDPERKQSLERSVGALTLPSKFRVTIHLGKCDDAINGLLDDLDRSGSKLAPTFAFLDPFGFSHTPFSLVKRLMGHRGCEVLITFMYEEINRFLSQEQVPQHFDALFGCAAWAQARQLSVPSQRRAFLRDLYRGQLEREAGATFVRSFEMLNQDNRTDYLLFFGTRSIEGLKKMKEAMWKVDETGTFQFSDATDPDQTVLFQRGPDIPDLRRRLLDAFRGQDASIDDIEEFVVTQTPYRETHYKRPVLIPMEKADPPQLVVIAASPARKRFTYPVGTVVRLL